MRSYIGRLFSWGETFTRIDLRYLMKGGFWLGIGRGISAFIGLLLAVAFANLLDPTQYGVYKFTLSLASFLWAFSLTGMPSALTRAVAQGKHGTLSKAAQAQMLWSGLITVGALLIALYYFANGNQTLATALLFIGVFSPFIKTGDLFNAFLTGTRAFKTKTVFGIFRDLLPALSLITALFLTNNPVILIATYCIAHSVAALFFFFLTYKKYRGGDTDETVIGDAKHLSLINVLGKAAVEVDKILLFHYFGAATLATYAFAYAPVIQLQGFGTTIKTLASAKLPTRSRDELRKKLPYKILILSVAIVPIVGLYVYTAPYIYIYLFPQYITAVQISQVLALSMLVTFPAILIRETFIATRHFKPLYITRTIVPIIRLTLLVVLIPPFGIWGAVASLLIPQTFNLLLLGILFITMKSPTQPKLT